MLNKTPILMAVSCLCCAAIAWAQPGSGASKQEAAGTPTTEGVTKMSKHKHTSRGGDGGSVSRWQPDKTLTVFTGEEGHTDGSGGQGGSPNDAPNAWQVASDENGVIVRGHGRVAQISWKDIDALRKQSQ
jgi:hypothetical protein